MNAINNTCSGAGAGGYQLKDELARNCLPAPHAHDQRNLAWTNSICLLFLIIGLAGFRPTPPPRIPVKPLEEPAPVIIEAAQTPPPVAELQPDDQPLAKPDSPPPRVVVVVPTAPGIKFAVPTTNGVLVAPKEYTVTPPAAAVQEAAPPRQEPAPPSHLENTGQGGARPSPPYPKMAEQLGQQGSVELLLTADEAGVIISAEVRESSGSTILDSATTNYVQRHWTVSPGANGRLFQAKITYKLTSD
jgi:TonB family protein